MGTTGSRTGDFEFTVEDFRPFPIVIRKDGLRVEVSMPVPQDYPETPLFRFLLKNAKEEEDEDEVVMSFVTIRMSLTQKKDDTTLFIHTFYVTPSLYMHVASPKEVALFRGVGKRALCAVVTNLAESGILPRSIDKVRLEASGGSCEHYSAAEKRRILADVDRKSIAAKSHESHIARIWGWISHAQEIIDTSDDAEEIQEKRAEQKANRHELAQARRMPPPHLDDDEICGILENRKLIRYYQTALGFRVAEDRFSYAVMEAPLDLFLSKCKDV